MAELQQVTDLSVNDHVLRNTAGSCRLSQELRKRKAFTCMTSTLITLKQSTGIMNLSVALPVGFEMYA